MLQQLERLNRFHCQNLRGIFTDIDDTLTTNGAITPDAFEALADIKEAGLSVVAITGRPVGWSRAVCGAVAGGVASSPKTGLWPCDGRRRRV